jgi:hypothetical protein
MPGGVMHTVAVDQIERSGEISGAADPRRLPQGRSRRCRQPPGRRHWGARRFYGPGALEIGGNFAFRTTTPGISYFTFGIYGARLVP